MADWDRLEQRLNTGKWPDGESLKETAVRDRYFLTEMRGSQSVEREVTLEEYCRAERNAGFRPSYLRSTDPAFMTTPATGSFSSGRTGISGRAQRAPIVSSPKGPM